MNKSQLINIISEKTKFSKQQTKIIINETFNTITSFLKKGEIVQIIGFGTFKVNFRAARVGRNPQTGKEIKIKATKVPVFVSGKSLKSAVK
ncbi:HU family DNA-binding protein [Buchnera aphidicola]|uniref:HU family DNA-binding protein n=1 Tax=Buchnera aphidicola TaxID=9 RepID=UPI0031B815CB